MKNTIKTFVVLAILAVVLYMSNPSMNDFGAYYERRQVSASQQGVGEGFKKLSKALAQSGADLAVKIGFKRDDKLFLSFFTLGSASRQSQRYMGFAKVVFIKIK